MEVNKELDLAWRFINTTGRNVFLTGKAGTGKTTFLHRLKQDSLKRMVVVAPTGVAAINAKGVTIHSFFQLPFGPILPDAELSSKTFNRKFSKTKINIIKSIDLLVIDEISMVRADVLDGIDRTLRRFRQRDKVFGGLQLLMIGDLQQLSPVIKPQEWELLKGIYANGFFFSSTAFKVSNAITIELKHIYRQDNPTFINILNAIRDNTLTDTTAALLNKRYKPDFKPEPDEGYIALTTHNTRAEATNNLELKQLKGKSKTYNAIIEGKFPEYAYPNPAKLELKVGAQVMFVKNDSGIEKRYFNGKIGKVIHLDTDEVIVHCPDDEHNIVVTPELWENINYSVNAETKAITEERIGGYMQIPLRLAWSITIHKSQGLTFEKAIIDVSQAFAHGQTYVALSRCKSLEGLVLTGKVEANHIISDSNVLRFNKSAEANTPDVTILEQSQYDFQLDVIREIFEFYAFMQPLRRVLDIYYKNANSIEGNIEDTFLSIKTCLAHFLKVAHSFNIQLQQLSIKEGLAEQSNVIQERFVKALNYYKEETDKKLVAPLKALVFTTDNQTIGAEITKHLETFESLLHTKVVYFNGFRGKFRVQTFLELRAKAIFGNKQRPKQRRKQVVEGTRHVALFEALRELRNAIAEQNDIAVYQVFTQKALYSMCDLLPYDKDGLLKVHGMGKTRVEKYGDEIINVITTFCETNGIKNEALFKDETVSRRRKGETKTISLNLFKKGKSITAIANERELNENTIFGHLASFIPTGEVHVTDLIPEAHFNDLKAIIPTKTFDNLSDLKHQLDEKYSYAELRLVLELIDN